ncbi:MAG: drug/metabolite exporter YedA, partial [Chloroflexota bacterium]|nr:drug/metabolite exporter YedA [Chloroflexota bacterium]
MKTSYSINKTVQEHRIPDHIETGKEALQSPLHRRIAILLSLLALYLVWGSTYLAMRIGLDGFPPFLLVGIRFVIAGGILYPILRMRGAPAPNRAQWIGAGIIGALLLVGGNGGVVFAEQWVSSGLAAVAIAAVPIWTALFVGLWGRWPTRIEWFGLLLGFTGIIILNFGNNVWASPLGAAALLLSPVCWALGSAWSSHISLPEGMMSSAAQMIVGGLILLIVSLGLREHAPNLAKTESLWALGFLIVFGSLVAFT